MEMRDLLRFLCLRRLDADVCSVGEKVSRGEKVGREAKRIDGGSTQNVIHMEVVYLAHISRLHTFIDFIALDARPCCHQQRILLLLGVWHA